MAQYKEFYKFENITGDTVLVGSIGSRIDGLPVIMNKKVSTSLKNDYYSVYSYGNLIKIVYHKVGRIARKENLIKSSNARSENERFLSSLSRSKSRVFELAICNEFNYFCTFTQDKNLRDRFDLTAFRKDFTMLIRNLNRSRAEDKKIKYILIPEQHKNGAWHLHGLFQNLDIDTDLRPFKLSERIPERIKKQIRNGEQVYDWTAYRRRFGFFTCTKIKDNTAVSKYITKYISKDFSKSVRDKNEHLFFASQGLKSRECLVKNSFDFCPFTDFDYENDYIKIKTFSLDDIETDKLSLLFSES